ncbi:MAG: hypothetical protein ACI392_01780 [Paludibacteraceae bacterium]
MNRKAKKQSQNDSEVIDGELNGHEYVDHGLPSGLKWATCNVGATKPEEYGNYYTWGETTAKTTYNWSSYQWCDGSDVTLTKYNTSRRYGIVDNKTMLDPENDAARANWGGQWRMPIDEEWEELLGNCEWTWTTRRGVKGYEVKSKINGNSIFLPAAGYRTDGDWFGEDYEGYYWSSSTSPWFSESVAALNFSSNRYNSGIGRPRDQGCSIRPVFIGR